MRLALNHLEYYTTIVSLCTLALSIRQYIATWPINIAITLLNLPLYYQANLFDRLFSAGISITFSLYGWFQWKYGGPNYTPLKQITKTSLPAFFLVTMPSIACTGLFSKILIHLHSDLPYLGALNTMLMIIGLWMTANKKLETYLIWFLMNIISVYIHYSKGYYWFSIKYFIYLFASIYGYYQWWKLYCKQVAD